MRGRKKIVLSTVALAGMMTTLVGCGNQAEETTKESIEVVTTIENPVEIEFWHAMSGAMGETLDGIIQTFNETVGVEKGIKVEGIFNGSYNELNSKVMAAIKAGNAPEIIQGTSNSIMDLIPSGVVQSLDEYIYHEEIGMKDYEDIYEAFRQEGQSFDETGTIYALPFSKSTDLYYYDEGFFNEHHLEVPTTWEEVVEISKRMTEITGRPSFGIDNLTNYFYIMLEQYGVPYTSKTGEILFNNETSVNLLNDLKTHIDGGYYRLAGEDMYHSGPFMSGLVQSYVGSSAGYAYLTDDVQWNTAPLPQVDPSNPVYIQQGNIISILNQNKSSEEVFGAYTFLKYLCSEEAILEWSTNTGYLPIRQSITSSEPYLAYLKETNDCVKQNGAISLENAFVEPLFATDRGVSSNIVRNEIGVMIEEILLSGTDIRETLSRYESKLK